MPPAKEPRPDAKATEKVVAWIEAELAKNGKSTVRPQPQYGNDEPHAPLFDPANATLPASTPARYWRLSPFIYKQYMIKLNSGAGNNLVSPFNLLPGNGFRDYALPATIDEPVAALLWINAESLINARFRKDPKGKYIEQRMSKELAALLDDQADFTKATLELVLKNEFIRVLRRQPSPEELTRWQSLMKKNIDAAGTAIGTRMTLTALLLHPEVVYRKEVGEGTADAHGRRMLSPRELVFAINYALGDKVPDDALWKAADAGRLGTREDVTREVNRILDDPKFEKTRLMRFFHEYFGYRHANTVFKTDAPKGAHDANWSIDDTNKLIGTILTGDKNVVAELLTTQEVWLVTEPFFNKNSRSFYVYNFPGPQPHQGKVKDEIRSLTVAPEGQRAGILTQPSWLLAHSTNFENHAIARGHWIREHLLGGTIPEIPLNVDAKLPDDKDKTLRQRMHVTRVEYCWKCHQKMDPLGLPFEIYDHFGRHRETETVVDPNAPPPQKKNQKPVTRELPLDPGGAITGTGDPSIDGPVKNAFDMMQKLGHSSRVEQVFVRHAFRYWMGRNETLSDAGTLQAAHKAYKDSGGSFRAIVVSLLTSDSFLYRRGDVPPLPMTTLK